MKYFLICLTFFSTVCLTFGQEMSSKELLQKSIEFHDPNGVWFNSKIELIIHMQIPNRPMRPSKIILDHPKDEFVAEMVSNDHLVTHRMTGEEAVAYEVDFMKPDSVLMDSLNLNLERTIRWRDYYGYLYGLPMKLNDPGTKLGQAVLDERFMGQAVKAIRVTYDKDVGSDIWYFYFHPETFAMVGYRFYHDEAANDGEYIVLEGMEIENGLRIPKNRTWYTNAEDRLLGTDYLMSLTIE